MQDAKRTTDDVRLPANVRMRKGRLNLEAEAEVRAELITASCCAHEAVSRRLCSACDQPLLTDM